MKIYEISKWHDGSLRERYGVILPYNQSFEEEVIENDAIKALSKYLDISIKEDIDDDEIDEDILRYFDSEGLMYECTNAYIIPNNWESFGFYKSERTFVKKYYNECETLYCFDFKKIKYADGVFYFEKGNHGEYLKLNAYSTYVFNM